MLSADAPSRFPVSAVNLAVVTVRRTLPRWLLGLLLAVAAVLGPASAASAHATIVSSSPADGEVSPTGPTSVTVRFSERVDPELASLTLVPPDKAPVTLTGLRSGANGSELTAALPALGEGVYRVTYKVRDPIDLHIAAGSIVFGVGNVAVANLGGVANPAPRPVDVALRWFERVGIALFVGAAALVLLVLPRLGDEVAAARRALRLVGVGAAVQFASLLALYVSETIDVGSPYGRTAWRLLTSASFGRRVVAGLLVAGALVVLSRLLQPLLTTEQLARWRKGRFDELGVALAVMVVAACVIVSLAGHAGTGGSFAVGALIRLVHLLAMGAWAGGLVAAVLVRRHLRRAGALWPQFSRLALVAVLFTVVTGLVLSGREIANVTALLTSWFGRLLLVKLAVLVVAGVLGIDHYLAVARGRRLGRRGLVAEGAVALLIVAGGAALSTTPPAVGAYYDDPVPPSPAAPAITIDDVVVKLELRPNRPGANLVRATVASSRRPEPGAIAGVTLDFRPLDVDGQDPIVVKGPAPANGVVDFGQVTLPVAGAYQVEVQVDRPDAPLALSIVSWTVDAPQPPRASTFVSDAKLAPITTVAAITAAVIGLLLVVRVSRRRDVLPPDDEPDGAQVVGSQAGRADS